MNCCWIILLLLFCGNGCNGNCGNNCPDTRRGRDCRGNERAKERESSCGCQAARPAAWNNNSDCGCDDEPTRVPNRQDFPGFNRGETCGCENEQN